MSFRWLQLLRNIYWIPVIGVWVISNISLVYGLIIIVQAIKSKLEFLPHNITEEPAGMIWLANMIEGVNLLLLGVIFFLTSVGLYNLFADQKIRTLGKLRLDHFDQTIHLLLDLIMIILTLQFLAQVFRAESATQLIIFGLSIVLVIGAITFFKTRYHQKSKES